MFPYNSVCVGNEFMELTHGYVKVEEQTCRFTGLDLDICLSNIDTTSSVSFGHPSKSLGNVFIYSGRRFYQFNEDDFLIQFLFLPIFQKAWIHIKWCTFKWIVLPVYWYCTKCFICTIICFVLFRYWYCTRCIYCTAKCLVLSIYWYCTTCLSCTVIYFVLPRCWYCTTCLYCTVKCYVLPRYLYCTVAECTVKCFVLPRYLYCTAGCTVKCFVLPRYLYCTVAECTFKCFVLPRYSYCTAGCTVKCVVLHYRCWYCTTCLYCTR